jgi:ATP-dependent RNA helicase RhlE
MMSFKDFKLQSEIEKAIEKAGFTKPTEVQSEVIPLVLQLKDIRAQAQTGSGKSLSFILPVLHHYSQQDYEGKAKPRVLVLTPTRELTLQIAQEFEKFSQFMSTKPSVVSIIGGAGLGDQMKQLQQGCDIVVATSGRLVEILKKQQLYLNKIEFFILDEADRMLDLGFKEELSEILPHLPKQRQNLMFSATYPDKMLEIAAKITSNAVKVTVVGETESVSTIQQRSIAVNSENRGPLLRHLLDVYSWQQVVVFMGHKRAADNIAAKFRKYKIKADALHGDLTQEDRAYTLKAFKEKKFRVLFTTDLAARGLDIEDLACVINFDLPRAPSDYIHRIGRTGRAGKKGYAISFIGLDDEHHFRLIEKRSKIRLEREQIEGFELVGTVSEKVRGLAPVKGKKKSKKDKLREAAQKNKS